ncbi:MAG: hypothetical protein ACI31C_05530 [Muribaculaceae bacterium]
MSAVLSETLIGTLVPIFVCVVLPVSIVWLVSRAGVNKDRQRSQVVIEALKNNPDIDINNILKSYSDKEKTPQEKLQSRLLRGVLFSILAVAITFFIIFDVYGLGNQGMLVLDIVFYGLGISNMVVFFLQRKQLAESQQKNNNTEENA